MDRIKLINKIVWWIPFKNLRNFVRNKLINIFYRIYEHIDNIDLKINNFESELDKYYYKLSKITPQPYLKLVDIHLAEHCNLHCYSCNSFAQLSKEKYLDINEFERDISRLYEITNGLIKEIHFIGGEPLLNKNCIDYFALGRKYFKNSIFDLWTNGILLSKQNEDFWKACSEYKVRIVITLYPININLDFIKKKAREYNIQIRYTNGDGSKYSYKFVLSNERKNNAFESFTSCYMANQCITLKNGRLHTCVISAKVDKFNKYYNRNLEVSDFDSIDIHKANSYVDILNFLSKPIPFCEYCDVKNWKVEGLWKHSSKDISEYTID